MPNVPQVSGVPPLTSYGPGAGLLLASDALVIAELAAAPFFPLWGIYLNGTPVIQPASVATSAISSVVAVGAAIATPLGLSFPIFASFIDFELKQDFPLSNYPVEQGGFQSYNKVQLPFDIVIRMASGGTATQRQQFLDAIADIASSLSLFDVQTPEGAYRSCNVTHWEFKRTAENGVSLIVVDMMFQQINVTSTATTPNTQNPAVAGPQAIGNVSPAAPSASVASGVSGNVN
jgi:hypothetical protein